MNMSDEELSMPVLDFQEEKTKENLPEKIPDVFDEAEVEGVIKYEKDLKIESLLKDIAILIDIGNLESAKEEYKKLIRLFNGLSLEQKKHYFKRVNAAYEEVVHPKKAQKKLREELAKELANEENKPI